MTGEIWADSYGANPSAPDNTAFFNAALAAASAGNKILRVPAGRFTCLSPVPLIDTVTIAGCHKLASGLVFPSSNGIIAGGFTTRIAHLGLSAPGNTALSLGTPTVGNNHSVIEDVQFTTAAIAIACNNLSAGRILNNGFVDFSNTGIWIDEPLNSDGGDNWIDRNWMINTGALTGTGVGIQHIAGGGYKYNSNKILATSYGYLMNANFRSETCSDVQIIGGSFEGQTAWSVFFTQQPPYTGALLNVQVVGLQMGGAVGNSGAIGSTQLGAGKWINRFVVDGCIVNNTKSGHGFDLSGIRNLVVGMNALDNNSSPQSGAGIQIESTVQSGFVIGNGVDGGTWATEVNNLGSFITAINNGP
jgi:hypothetical protein